MSQPYRYIERQPSIGVARLVLSYWSFQSDAPMPDEPYTVFPDGCASIACVRPPNARGFVALVGPRVTHLRPPFSAGTRVWGVRLWPDAISATLGVPARSLRNLFGALPKNARPVFANLPDIVPGSDDPDEVFPALDEWLVTVLGDAPNPDPRIRTAIHSIVRHRGEGSMEAVAREAAIGLRHLQRLFPEATGLTMREYARIRRVREALAMRLIAGTSRWSEIAAGTGFVDHAHLTREFVALAGVAPSVAAQQLRTTIHSGVRP